VLATLELTESVCTQASLNHVTDSCRLLVSRFPALVCSLQYEKHSYSAGSLPKDPVFFMIVDYAVEWF